MIAHSQPQPQSTLRITVGEFVDDVYPAIIIQDPPSLWSRIKKSVSNLMANVFCGVASRTYQFYVDRNTGNNGNGNAITNTDTNTTTNATNDSGILPV